MTAWTDPGLAAAMIRDHGSGIVHEQGIGCTECDARRNGGPAGADGRTDLSQSISHVDHHDGRNGRVAGHPPADPDPGFDRHATTPPQPVDGMPSAAPPPKTEAEQLADLTGRYILEAQARQAARETLAVAGQVLPDPPRTLSDIRASPKHLPGWWVSGLVAHRAFVTVVGARKVGKTTTVGSLLLAVLDGKGAAALDRVEWEVTDALTGGVLILSYEMGEEWQDWLRAQGVTDSYGDRVRIWDLLGTANPLTTAAGRAALASFLDGVSLVVIDTFAQAYFGGLTTGGINEEVNAWLNLVRAVIGPDRMLWLTVHAGWDGSRSRGASAIEDQPTTIITLERAADGTRFISTRGRRVEEVRRLPLSQDQTTQRVTVNAQGPSWAVANAKDTDTDDDARHAAREDQKRARAIATKESEQWAALRFLASRSDPAGRRVVASATNLSEDKADLALNALMLRGCVSQAARRAGWVVTATGTAAAEGGHLPPIRGGA